MLLRRDELKAIYAGEVTVAFRRWVRPTVKAGGTLMTSFGVLGIDSVEVVDPEALTEADAAASGHPDLAALEEAVDYRTDRALYRVRLHYAGPDPRIALRNYADLAKGDLEYIQKRLDRYDAASRHGPWTHEVLELIAEKPEVRAPDLAAGRGMETQPFKADVRKLKALGLTESLKVGYRLSPRGKAYLEAVDTT